MRTAEKIRVRCEGCGWSGGRAMNGSHLDAPCSKCGGICVEDGDPYLEVRVLAGCPACGWWGERPPTRVGAACPRCEGAATVPARVVLDAAS